MVCWYFELSVVVISSIISLYIWSTWHYDTLKKRGISFQTPVPFFGNMAPFWLGQDAFGDFQRRIYKTFQDASVVGMFDFRQPMYMIRDPDIIKLVTTKDFEHFVDHKQLGTGKDDILFGRCVFLLRGSQWKSMRNILSPAFTSSKMKSMFTLVTDCANQMGNYLQDKCKAKGNRKITLNSTDLFTRSANDIIATSAFGIHCDSLRDQNNEFYMIGKQALDFTGLRMFRFLTIVVFPKLTALLDFQLTSSKVTKFFINLVTGTMKTREEKGIIRPDMIHLLMQAKQGTLRDDDDTVPLVKQEPRNNKVPDLSDEDITAQAFIFFFAGFETSSVLHCFVAHELAEHPDVQRRVQQEIDAVIREDGGKLTYEGVVHRMKYLDMVISETLRLWPPVREIDRVCVKSYTIPATASTPIVEIKKGQNIDIPVLSLHRDPQYYPDPDVFDPERFSEENKHKINPFVYLPFGTGPRACLGLRFAMMATKVIFVNILTRFNLEPSEKMKKPLKYTKRTANTSVEGGFWVKIEPRAKADNIL